jgi:flagellar biosynthesis GTPase FlhF
VYKEVKSEFIKNLIRQTSYRDVRGRKYIDELITLERFIVDGVHSWGSALHYRNLKEKYRREWEAIYKELKPEEFKQIIERKEREAEERRREIEEMRRQELEEEMRKKKEWLEMGGLE